jgi:hypothetical protein
MQEYIGKRHSVALKRTYKKLNSESPFIKLEANHLRVMARRR